MEPKDVIDIAYEPRKLKRTENIPPLLLVESHTNHKAKIFLPRWVRQSFIGAPNPDQSTAIGVDLSPHIAVISHCSDTRPGGWFSLAIAVQIKKFCRRMAVCPASSILSGQDF